MSVDPDRYDLQFRNIPDVLLQRSLSVPHKIAVIDRDLEYTYADVARLTRHAASGFRRMGLQPGDRFAVQMENRIEWIVAALGAMAVGGILVPVSTRYQPREVLNLLEKSGTELLITSSDGPKSYFAGLTEGEGVARLRVKVVVVGADAEQPNSFSRLMADEPIDAVAFEALVGAILPEAISDIMFTSGTTGEPKGVVARHGQTIRAHGTQTTVVGLEQSDRVLVIPPFFHSWGYKSGWLASMIHGATSVPVARFDAIEAMRMVERHRVSVLPAPPTVFLDILDSPRRPEFDLSSLRLTFPAATTVPGALVLRIKRELGVELVSTAYGLTETMAIVTANRPDDTLEHITQTVGRPIAGCDVRIVDEVGVARSTGETGEIEIRGFNVTTGYWNDPWATVALFDGEWARSGDIGFIDADGYLCVTDRKKDMFINGGFNAYPAEIELVLSAHPAIQRVAVVGVTDARAGEVGAAFIVLRSGEQLTPEELLAWSGPLLANFKIPRHVHIVDDLIYNSSGKVLKSELKAQHDLIVGEQRPVHHERVKK